MDTFRVRVFRIQTHSATVEVRAGSVEQARTRAIETAQKRGFAGWIDDGEEVETGEVVVPGRKR